MRILLSSEHDYPACNGIGSGLHPKAFPSGSGYMIQDLLAKGLAELGHQVFYLVRHAGDNPSPPGVTLVFEPRQDADVLHTISDHDADLVREWQSRDRAWVTTCHMDRRTRGKEQHPITENWIFVSRTLAQLHGRNRYVLNGIDPEACIYSESKQDYFFFMSSMDWEMEKGLDVALSLAFRVGIRLVVAGTANNYERISRIAALCRHAGASYVGDVRGRQKAELLAGAKAFLFPTKLAEAFGLGMAEALMSGTPVICSDRGACPEIISPDVGFVCKDEADYVAAIDRIGDISHQVCRDKAMREYHYLRMAADYITEYERELAGNGNRESSTQSTNT